MVKSSQEARDLAIAFESIRKVQPAKLLVVAGSSCHPSPTVPDCDESIQVGSEQ